jgi:carbon-monoxide dehydrogenase medium subunit
MKLRISSPTTLVDLRRISDLQRINAQNGSLEIGSMVTYRTLINDSSVSLGCSLLAECASAIGDNQVRARGTIGGSLAHADPAADLPAAILALDATLLTTGGDIAAGDFFTDLFTTALASGQLLTGVRVPASNGKTASAYIKVRNKASHYALVGAAAVVTMADDGTCSNIAVALTGAASKAFRLTDAEGKLKGTRLEDGDLSGAFEGVSSLDVDWMDDLFGSADYRKHLAAVVAQRAVQTAKSRL